MSMSGVRSLSPAVEATGYSPSEPVPKVGLESMDEDMSRSRGFSTAVVPFSDGEGIGDGWRVGPREVAKGLFEGIARPAGGMIGVPGESSPHLLVTRLHWTLRWRG